MKRRFAVFDWYDCFYDEQPLLVGFADDKLELDKLIQDWDIETDGECSLQIVDREEKKSYKWDAEKVDLA